MREEQVRRLLDQPAPGEQAAGERGWRVLRPAFDERRPVPRRSRTRNALIAVGAALAVTVVALTPAGANVADWIRDAVDPGRKDARPALVSLPAPGRLLVNSQQGPWIVESDGSRRLVGGYDDASWSPGGLFVVATRGREVVAVEPRGRPRWALARPAPVSRARWSPDGFRIAYLSGRELRVVAGDGTGDAAVAADVATLAPAWRPGTRHVLAFVDSRGRVRVMNTDSRKLAWRSAQRPAPTQLAWSSDGSLLLAVSTERLTLFNPAGLVLSQSDMPPGTIADGAAFRPGSDAFALASHTVKGDRSRLSLVHLAKGSSSERVLLSGAGRFGDLAWSPDAEWLLGTWPSADQWVFILPGERRRGGIEKLQAVANISRQFSPGAKRAARFPGLGGWCCPR